MTIDQLHDLDLGGPEESIDDIPTGIFSVFLGGC